MKYFIVIEKMGNNYGAYSPDVNGCIATGKTVSETIKHMQEAIEWHLEDEKVTSKGITYWLDRIDEISKPNAIFMEISVGDEVTGTKEAFELVLSERGIYKKLGVDRSTVANWKKYAQRNEMISTEKMEQVLLTAGWKNTGKPTWQRL